MQLDIFSEEARVTKGIKHKNGIIWNYSQSDFEQMINSGQPFEIIEDQKLDFIRIGNQYNGIINPKIIKDA